jgi:hypothetical protein
MALARMLQPFASWAQRRYQAGLAEKLKDYGLRYDDLYDPLMDMVRLWRWRGRWSAHCCLVFGAAKEKGGPACCCCVTRPPS